MTALPRSTRLRQAPQVAPHDGPEAGCLGAIVAHRRARKAARQGRVEAVAPVDGRDRPMSLVTSNWSKYSGSGGRKTSGRAGPDPSTLYRVRAPMVVNRAAARHHTPLGRTRTGVVAIAENELTVPQRSGAPGVGQRRTARVRDPVAGECEVSAWRPLGRVEHALGVGRHDQLIDVAVEHARGRRQEPKAGVLKRAGLAEVRVPARIGR